MKLENLFNDTPDGADMEILEKPFFNPDTSDVFQQAAKDHFYAKGSALSEPIMIDPIVKEYMLDEATVRAGNTTDKPKYTVIEKAEVMGAKFYLVSSIKYWEPGEYENRPLGYLESIAVGRLRPTNESK